MICRVTSTHEYEILDEIRQSSISDDEEPSDGTRYSFLLVRFSGGSANGGARRGGTSPATASHQLEKIVPSVLVGGQTEGSSAGTSRPDALRERAAEARHKHIRWN